MILLHVRNRGRATEDSIARFRHDHKSVVGVVGRRQRAYVLRCRMEQTVPHRSKIFVAGLLLAFGPGLVPQPTAAEAARLAPHRVVYELKLDRTRGNKPVAEATSRLSLESTGDACAGYATKFRQVTRLVDADGQPRLLDLKSEAFESGDGVTYKFRIATEGEGGRTIQESEGVAERASDGGISIDLRRPTPTRSDMEGEAIFPSTHMRRLVEAGRNGDRVLEVRVYDGSDGGEKVYDTTAIIGAPVPESGRPPEAKATEAGLSGMRRWPVAVSYFEPGPGERTPVLVMSYDLYENGVSAALRLDFGDFTLRGEMARLEMLPPSACTK
jgi:hypothetical protein